MIQKCFFFIIAFAVLSILINPNVFGQRRDDALLDIITQQLQTIYGISYEANVMVNVDWEEGLSLKSSFTVYGIDNPYETLSGCVLFTASHVDNRYKNLIGVYRNGSVVWISDTLIYGTEEEFFATRDLNLDGTVDIIVSFNEPGNAESAIQRVWIYSWDGNQGQCINALDDSSHFAPIEVNSYTLQMVDLDGDGILEFRSREKVDGSLAWSWNGQAYGMWPTTPHVPITMFLPATSAEADVECNVTSIEHKLQFIYRVQSRYTSKRRIECFYLDHYGPDTLGLAPKGWYFWGKVDSIPLTWNWGGWDNRDMISLGKSDSSFITISEGLPAISRFYVQSEHGRGEIDENPTFIDDFNNDYLNSFQGNTIAPFLPPNPFIPITFLDTLSGYTTQSRTLGWIKDSLTAVKYLGYFSTAKTKIQQNDTATAKSTLRQVLTDVDIDSTNHLTSEAYALLRFNTEYLIPRIVPLDTLRVPSQYATIQAAVNAADSGKTILVSAGTYNEQDSIINKKSLKLIAVDTLVPLGNVTIQGVNISNSSNITIKGFKIYASGTSQDAVQITGAQNTNITIEANEIQNSSKNGITLGQNSDTINIVNNVIANNGENGINFATGATGTQYIVNNTIVKNGKCGIEAVGPQKLLIVNNIIIYDTLAGRSGERLIKGAGTTYIMQKNNLVLRRQNGVLQSDYRLVPGSIAIDKGTTNFAPLPGKDKDGNSRISGTKIDVGAYEYQQ